MSSVKERPTIIIVRCQVVSPTKYIVALLCLNCPLGAKLVKWLKAFFLISLFHKYFNLKKQQQPELNGKSGVIILHIAIYI